MLDNNMREFKIGDIKSVLTSKYSGKETTFVDIVESVIDETLFLEKDIRAAIKEMKKEGLVSTTPVTSKTDRGLKGDDIVTFEDNNIFLRGFDYGDK